MPQRYLPLYGGGDWIMYPSLALWCVMNYCDDVLSAKRATVLLSEEIIEREAGRQQAYSRIAQLAYEDLNRHVLRGCMCGNIALQVAANIVSRGEPCIGRAVHAVARWGAGTKTHAGRALPADPTGLRRYFIQYRNVAHLWAAYELLDDEKQESLHTLNRAVLEEMLIVAMKFEQHFDEARAFPDWNPWRVPLEFKAAHPSTRYKLNMPTESEWLRRVLAEYRKEAIR